jgi:hypothetical protein
MKGAQSSRPKGIPEAANRTPATLRDVASRLFRRGLTLGGLKRQYQAEAKTYESAHHQPNGKPGTASEACHAILLLVEPLSRLSQRLPANAGWPCG